MKVVIFGATGKIGRYLVDHILEQAPNMEIIAAGHRKDSPFDNRIAYYGGSIENSAFFDRLPQKADAIINLAGAVTTRVNSNDVMQYVQTNIIGAVNILNYAVRAQAERVIYSQTYNDVFGASDSETIIHPYSRRKSHYSGEAALYSITKNTAVDLLQYYSDIHKFKPFILRLPTVYCYTPNPYYLIGGKQKLRPFWKMIFAAEKGDNIEVWGNPDHVMDMVYVKDCARMFFLALTCPAANGGIYNVGTGVGTTLQEQAEGIIEVFSQPNNKSSIVYCPEKPNGKPYIMDISNAMDELGYYPRYSYIEMLNDIKKEKEQQRDIFQSIK